MCSHTVLYKNCASVWIIYKGKNKYININLRPIVEHDERGRTTRRGWHAKCSGVSSSKLISRVQLVQYQFALPLCVLVLCTVWEQGKGKRPVTLQKILLNSTVKHLKNVWTCGFEAPPTEPKDCLTSCEAQYI